MIPFVRVSCARCGSFDADCVVRTPDYEKPSDVMFEVVRCRHCGFVYTATRPHFNVLFKEFYPDDYLCYGTPTESRVADFIESKRTQGQAFQRIRLVSRHIQIHQTTRVLEVGCGTARFARMCREKYGADVTGVEPNARLCEYLRSEGVHVVNAPFETAELPDQYYDLVCMFHVLEHVWNPIYVLKRLNSILKTGGLLFLEMPNFGASARKLFGKYWFNYHQPRHLTHFDKESLSEVLEESGFNVVQSRYEFRPTINAVSLQYAVADHTDVTFLRNFFSFHNPLIVLLGIGLEVIFSIFGKLSTMTVLARKTGQVMSGYQSLLEERRIEDAGSV